MPVFLSIPPSAKGMTVFSHGSGSSRYSERNGFVAEELQKEGFGTLLFDLLTEQEDRNYSNRFDIPLLTERTIEAVEWVKQKEEAAGSFLGLFGASTGAASALNNAARLGERISVVVSRGGRSDLSQENLEKVTCPTLLIVGGLDLPVIEMNKKAYGELNCEKRMEIVEGATHLFEEPGKLEEVGGWRKNGSSNTVFLARKANLWKTPKSLRPDQPEMCGER